MAKSYEKTLQQLSPEQQQLLKAVMPSLSANHAAMLLSLSPKQLSKFIEQVRAVSDRLGPEQLNNMLQGVVKSTIAGSHLNVVTTVAHGNENNIPDLNTEPTDASILGQNNRYNTAHGDSHGFEREVIKRQVALGSPVDTKEELDLTSPSCPDDELLPVKPSVRRRV